MLDLNNLASVSETPSITHSCRRNERVLDDRMMASKSKDFSYAMNPLRILSWPVGIWPLQDYNAYSFARFICTLFLLLLMLTIVNFEIYLDGSDTEKNLDALTLITCGILAISKVMYFRFRSDGLVLNFTSALKDYDELNEEENRKIMRQHAYMGRVACASVILFSYISSLLIMAVSMLIDDHENVVNVTLEHTLEYPIPSERVLTFFQFPESLTLPIFVTEFLMLLITCTGNLGSDSLFFAISFHLCGQVEILKTNFSRVLNKNKNPRENFYLSIKRHSYLLELGEMLNDTIGSILIVQLFSSSILICIAGFQFILALNDQNIAIVVKSFAILSTFTVQLFAYSYVGDYLKHQMESIGYSLYSCNWYDFPRNVSKDISFVIMKTHRSFHLMAGKFFIVNMETYASILKTSLSYLSVLRVMINA